jgi:hypothetical protein
MKALALVMLVLLFSVGTYASAAEGDREMTITVAVSPKSSFASTLTLEKVGDLPNKLLHCKTVPTAEAPELVRATITIGKRTFTYDYLHRLIDEQRKRRVLLPSSLQAELEKWVSVVEQAHYGRLLHWEQVRREFRRMSYATVIDLETGERFRVQRRAGSRHADVQPLTSSDTNIMKTIYQGKWSWKRRAILVEVNGKYFAASMHGMPHGAGAIRGNKFPGHFCIHFYGSSTHQRKEPDPSHSLMILKASGKLAETVMSAEPVQLVDYFLTSLNEHDPTALQMMTDGFPLPEELQGIENVKRVDEPLRGEQIYPLTAEIPVGVDCFHKQWGERKSEWIFVLRRNSPLDRWKICDLQIAR